MGRHTDGRVGLGMRCVGQDNGAGATARPSRGRRGLSATWGLHWADVMGNVVWVFSTTGCTFQPGLRSLGFIHKALESPRVFCYFFPRRRSPL